MIVHACHCIDCQRLTGSAFALNAWLENDQVELLSGGLARFRFDGSGKGDSDVHFCPQCGAYLWTEYGPGFWFVRVGILDDPTQFAPDMHIWTRSKQPWMRLPGGVPAFEMYYDKEKVWPAESLARLATVAG